MAEGMAEGAAKGMGDGGDYTLGYASELELDGILEEERGVPAWKVQVILAVFTVVIAVNLLKVGR